MTCRDNCNPDPKFASAYWRSISRHSTARVPNLPEPEDVFLSWLLALPADTNLETAAREQIDLIDQRVPFHSSVASLRVLFAAVVSDCGRRKSIVSSAGRQ